MDGFSNTEDVIRLDKNAYVRITKEFFEYHYGIVDKHQLIIPIENIKVIFLKKTADIISNRGCFYLFSFLGVLFAGINDSPKPVVLEPDDLEQEADFCTLTIRYRSPEKKALTKREITWPGLTLEKAQTIVRLVKMRNRNS